jgi:hypothetical protein
MREGDREGGREGGKKEGMERERTEGREGGREEGREGGREVMCVHECMISRQRLSVVFGLDQSGHHSRVATRDS